MHDVYLGGLGMRLVRYIIKEKRELMLSMHKIANLCCLRT